MGKGDTGSFISTAVGMDRELILAVASPSISLFLPSCFFLLSHTLLVGGVSLRMSVDFALFPFAALSQ